MDGSTRSIVLPGRFRAVVFDMDGILLDSEPLWQAAFQQVMRRRGGEFTNADRIATLGQALDDSAALLAPRIGLSASAMAAEIADVMSTLYGRGAPLHDGVRSLVDALDGRMPIAVATNTSADVARRALIAAGLGALGIVASGADLGRPKPRPDVYEDACRRLRVAPADAIAFEDSPNGIRAAAVAGLTVVGILAHGVDLSGAGADMVLGSLAEVRVES